MSTMKAEAFQHISQMDGLLDELVVDGTVQRVKLMEFVKALKSTGDAMGVELDMHYGRDYESMSEMVEFAAERGEVEYFELDAADVNQATLKEILDDLRQSIDMEEDDEDIAEFICEFACAVGMWLYEHQSDFNVPEMFTFMDVDNEDGNWDEDDSDIDEDGWERI